MRPHATRLISPHVRWRSWNGEAVAYDDASGDTHLLDASATQVLACLQEGSLDLANLMAKATCEDPGGPGTQDDSRAESIIDDLTALGLIVPSER